MTDYFERKLDDKNRLTIPVELREQLKSGVVITRGFGRYLHLYSQTVWDKEMEIALEGDILDERIADLNVQFRNGKTTAKMDAKQGRVVIEPHLIKFARISKSVTVVRTGKYWRISAS